MRKTGAIHAKKIPDEIRVRIPDIEWPRIAGLRDAMRHYAGLVAAIVLSIVCATALIAQPLPPPPNKTVIVIFENKDHDEIIGSCCAPYLNSLIQAGASLEFWA